MAKTSRPKSTPEQDASKPEANKANQMPGGDGAEEMIEPMTSEIGADPSSAEISPAPPLAQDIPPVVSEEPAPSPDKANGPERVAEPPVVETREIVRVEKQGGFLGMVVGGVIAAAAGYGAATYFPMQTVAPVPDTTTAEAVASLENALTAQSAKLSMIEERLNGLDDLASRLSSVEDRMAAGGPGVDLAPLQDAVDALGQRLATLESLPSGDSGPANAALSETIGAMQAEIDALKGQGETAAASMAAAAAEAEARLAEAEERAAELKAEAEETARKAMHSAAIGRILAAMESGAPFAAALGDLQGVTIPEALASVSESGVPTVAALAAAFPAAAREALDASRRATVGDGMADRITSLLQTATGARSLAPQEGSDPDAILSRAEAAVKSGDLDSAMAEIESLPPEGQAALTDWIGLAKLRIAALAGVADLSAAKSE